MTWQPLGPRLSSLPLILAGPILRKTTPTSVSVWLALKSAATVSLDVAWGGNPRVGEVLLAGSRASVRIGPNLHVVTVTATGTAPLLPETIYSYDLRLQTAAGPVSFEAAVGSPNENVATLAYSPYVWPTFSLPPISFNDLRVLCGSCRMPHADGPDALALTDALLAVDAAAPRQRPHQLLMTGDQIYADDVSDCLLLVLMDVAAVLAGHEPLPLASGAWVSPAELLPTTRTSLLREAGFTSPNTRSHLMTLGEFVAMYLLVWSNVLWPPSMPGYDDLVAVVAEPSARARLRGMRKAIEQDNVNVGVMRATLPAVRRALANVPTYMIFDDHEISDDWHLNRRFCEKVYGNPTGTRITQNALVAYSLCQHWGNVPEQFLGSAAGAELLSTISGASAYADVADSVAIRRVVGIHPASELALRSPFGVFHDTGVRTQVNGAWVDTASLIFNYTIESATHQIVVTNSRTWRSFKWAPLDDGDLIPPGQIVEQVEHTPPLAGRVLMVVMTTNMPPSPAIRQGRRDLPNLDNDYKLEDFYDSWLETSAGFASMLASLARKQSAGGGVDHQGQVVVISGDVHSSQVLRIGYFATTAQYDEFFSVGGQTARVAIAQLVGSSFKKQASKTLGQHDVGYEFVPDDWKARALKQGTLLSEGFIGWNKNAVQDYAVVGQIFRHAPLAEDGIHNWHYRTEWPIKPLRSEELPHVWSRHPVAITLSPHFRFRIDYLSATEGNAYRPQAPVAIVSPSNPDQAIEQYARHLRPHIGVSMGGGSDIVGRNNIGEVRLFRASVGGELSVKYIVRWLQDGNVEWVRFDVSLEPNATSYPPLYHSSEQNP